MVRINNNNNNIANGCSMRLCLCVVQYGFKCKFIGVTAWVVAMAFLCRTAEPVAEPDEKVCRTGAELPQNCRTNGSTDALYGMYENFRMW